MKMFNINTIIRGVYVIYVPIGFKNYKKGYLFNLHTYCFYVVIYRLSLKSRMIKNMLVLTVRSTNIYLC